MTLHHPATALAVATDMRGELASVRVGYTDSSTEVEIPVTRLLLAAGCWTPAVFRSLFPQASVNVPVTPLGGHSLVVRMPGWEDGAAQQDCHSVYCSIDELSPELYSRTNGVIYLAGVNSSAIPLPELATGSQPVEASIERLKDIARRMIATPEGEELQVVRTGLCFRPITPSGAPILDRIADEQLGPDVATRGGGSGGVFVAVGHGPWGISLSLGTGKVMAELMQGKEPSADISGLGL